MAFVNVPFVDYSNESSTASIRVADAITDANITAIFNAIVGVTLGNAQKSVLATSIDKDAGTPGAAANAFAQREIKWLVRYTDTVTGKKYRCELPTADLALVVAGSDQMDVGVGTAGETLVNALEANGLSQDGNAITIDSIQFVGRNT